MYLTFFLYWSKSTERPVNQFNFENIFKFYPTMSQLLWINWPWAIDGRQKINIFLSKLFPCEKQFPSISTNSNAQLCSFHCWKSCSSFTWNEKKRIIFQSIYCQTEKIVIYFKFQMLFIDIEPWSSFHRYNESRKNDERKKFRCHFAQFKERKWNSRRETLDKPRHSSFSITFSPFRWIHGRFWISFRITFTQIVFVYFRERIAETYFEHSTYINALLTKFKSFTISTIIQKRWSVKFMSA